MIQFDNSKASDNEIVLNFEGTPVSLAAEISCAIRAIYFKLCEQNPKAGATFKDCFVRCLDLTWLTSDEINGRLADTVLEKIKKTVEEHDTPTFDKVADDKEFINWLHSFDSDDDDDDDGDDDEWD